MVLRERGMRLSLPSPNTTSGGVTAFCVMLARGSEGFEQVVVVADLGTELVFDFMDIVLLFCFFEGIAGFGGLFEVFGRSSVLLSGVLNVVRVLGGSEDVSLVGGVDCFSPFGGGLLRGEGRAFVFICTTGKLVFTS